MGTKGLLARVAPGHWNKWPKRWPPYRSLGRRMTPYSMAPPTDCPAGYSTGNTVINMFHGVLHGLYPVDYLVLFRMLPHRVWYTPCGVRHGLRRGLTYGVCHGLTLGVSNGIRPMACTGHGGSYVYPRCSPWGSPFFSPWATTWETPWETTWCAIVTHGLATSYAMAKAQSVHLPTLMYNKKIASISTRHPVHGNLVQRGGWRSCERACFTYETSIRFPQLVYARQSRDAREREDGAFLDLFATIATYGIFLSPSIYSAIVCSLSRLTDMFVRLCACVHHVPINAHANATLEVALFVLKWLLNDLAPYPEIVGNNPFSFYDSRSVPSP